MRQKDDIARIAEKLALLQKRLAQQNKLGLYNLNRYAEDIVCRLLNLTFGWQLVNLNEAWPNCPAIDLADRERGICVQVTTARSAGKAVDTLRGLCKYHKNAYHRVLLFYLQGKPSSVPENDPRLELWDLDDLQSSIAECPKDTIAKSLAVLLAAEDEGLLARQSNLHTEDTWFTPKLEFMQDTAFGQHLLVSQQERVRLTAFVPLLEEMSCKIEFARRGTSDAHLTFDQQTILESLFSGHGGPAHKRGFSRGFDEVSDTAILQLGNCRYFVDADTAAQLCIVLDHLYDAYQKTRQQTCTILGIEGFRVPPDADWKQPLFSLPPFLWDAMWECAQQHNAYVGCGPWDVFDPSVPHSVIRIIRNPGSDSCGKSILAELQVTRQEGATGLCTVFWKRGHALSKMDWQGHDNALKWQANYTAHWVWKKWMPQLCKSLYQRQNPRGLFNWKLFKKTALITVEAFTGELLSSVTLYF